jgi:hypothetical protein
MMMSEIIVIFSIRVMKILAFRNFNKKYLKNMVGNTLDQKSFLQ